LSIIKHVTLQKIVAHDFQYDPRINIIVTTTTITCDNNTLNYTRCEGVTPDRFCYTTALSHDYIQSAELNN
jgi:hypothetical protein